MSAAIKSKSAHRPVQDLGATPTIVVRAQVLARRGVPERRFGLLAALIFGEVP